MSSVLRVAALLAAFAGAFVQTASAASTTAFYETPFEKKPDAATLTTLGRAMFFDRTLSASGRMACATCHDPAHAWGPPNSLAVQLGGADLKSPGIRAVPSLTYRHNTPPFNEHFSDTDGNDSIDQGPTGGRAWDGRADSAHAQAALPLLSPFEMANTDAAAVVERLRRSPNAQRFREAFGAHVLDEQTTAWNGLLLALEVFQQSPADFYPYNSKYDAFLRRKVQLTAAERRGLGLFNDPAKGNCASCHISNIKEGAFPRFTDDGLIAIGVPRNRAIPANRDPRYFDLGLCGPLREDLKAKTEYCGLFKTPPLRNVALRKVFFHNGSFSSLEEVVRFYAQRDTNPARFYGQGAKGHARRFDDLPTQYHGNVNQELPFGKHEGGKPALTDGEIRDIVAFMRTLTDGYSK